MATCRDSQLIYVAGKCNPIFSHGVKSAIYTLVVVETGKK